jgi:ribonuclease VapC
MSHTLCSFLFSGLAAHGGSFRLLPLVFGLATVSALEASIVIETRKGAAGGRDLDLLLHRANAEIVAFNAEQFELARVAYRRFGKGHHPAGLNPGDCCAYALARVSGESLLAKGNDFGQTDVRLVLGAE